MFIQDKRTTRQADETRCMANKKPFRSKIGRQDARRESHIVKSGRSRGTHVSYVKRQNHAKCPCGMQDWQFCGSPNTRKAR